MTNDERHSSFVIRQRRSLALRPSSSVTFIRHRSTRQSAPPPEGLLEAYAVSPAVNHTANDGPELIAPAAAPQEPAPASAANAARVPARRGRKKDERQPSLF